MVQVKRVDFRLHDWIDGKYKVERVLGHSGYDSKFKVVDRDGKQYMLKLLNLWQMDAGSRAKAGAKAESEIKSCSIPSNYLTQIVGSGAVMGNPYLLTQYYMSTDLSKNRNMGSVAGIIAGVLFGLKDLHKNGKVHGNLTAENVLKTDDGRILLTNYVTLGSRNRIVSEYVQKSAHRGGNVLPFVAPERFRDEKCASLLPTADIYSVGVLAYYLLSGRYPFGSLYNTEAYLHKCVSGQWNKAMLSGENAKWIDFIERALSSNPADRPQSADEALSLLPEEHSMDYQETGQQQEINMDPHNGVLLRLLQGDEYGKVYRLGELFAGGSRRILTLGREDGGVFNQIAIKETGTTFVSRRHATIELDNETGAVYIRDGQRDKKAKSGWMNSLNGTFVNSTEVSPEGMELKPGDIVSVGDVKLRVEGY